MNLESIDPKEWGPDFWRTLHRISAGYEDNPSPTTMNIMSDFILSIPTLLPCKECSEHAMLYISQRHELLPKITSSRKELFDFFFTFHNDVNKRLGKKQMDKSKAEVMYGIAEDKSINKTIFVVLIILVALVCIYLYVKKREEQIKISIF